MNKKNSFFPWSTYIWSFIVFITFAICLVVLSIVYMIIELNAPFWALIIIIFTFSLSSFLLIVGIKTTFHKLIIDEEKIILKGLFGIVCQCKISEIKRIYLAQGTKFRFAIIEDSINSMGNSKNFLNEKGKYIRFDYSKKREQIIKQFWRGEIEDSAK